MKRAQKLSALSYQRSRLRQGYAGQAAVISARRVASHGGQAFGRWSAGMGPVARAPGSGRPAASRAGFSLLELMVAIIILGIGMVMVATVFPIGIDMAAQNVQMNIAESVVNAAVGVLEVKLPVFKDLDNDLVWSNAVMVPDVRGTDLYATVSPEAYAVLVSLRPGASPPGRAYPSPPSWNNPGNRASVPPDWQDWASMGSVLSAADLVNYFSDQLPDMFDSRITTARARVFTERGAWDAETFGPNLTSMVWGQNLPRNYSAILSTALPSADELGAVLTTMPPPSVPLSEMPPLPGIPVRQDFPRVHLADQVYPPVPISQWNAAQNRFEPRPTTDIVRDIAGRRYSWLAVHHRVSGDTGTKAFVVSILVTHRADLNSVFAAQSISDPRRVPTNVAGGETDRPTADVAATTDTLFPQPWIVRFDSINLDNGLVTCTGWVARLLPPGSFFVMASTAGTSLFAGTPHQVLGRGAIPSDLDQLTTLQIARGSGTVSGALAWVVPPAYDRTRGTFQTKSPVVGVALRPVAQK